MMNKILVKIDWYFLLCYMLMDILSLNQQDFSNHFCKEKYTNHSFYNCIILIIRSLAEVEANFKSFNRSILGIIQTLYHNKAIKIILFTVFRIQISDALALLHRDPWWEYGSRSGSRWSKMEAKKGNELRDLCCLSAVTLLLKDYEGYCGAWHIIHNKV